MLCVDLRTESESNKLLQCIASLWIKIRGHSTAAALVEKYKAATATSTKGAKINQKSLKVLMIGKNFHVHVHNIQCHCMCDNHKDFLLVLFGSGAFMSITEGCLFLPLTLLLSGSKLNWLTTLNTLQLSRYYCTVGLSLKIRL